MIRRLFQALTLVSAGLLACHWFGEAAAGGGERPNFVIILANDQGWAGSNVMMDPKVKQAHSPWFHTPNLERLAASGIRFTDGYAAAPKCLPSRAGLLTGSSPARLRLTENGKGPDQEAYSKSLGGAVICPNEPEQLDRRFLTIGEFLKEYAPDYVTAHLGKWHVGRQGNGPARVAIPIMYRATAHRQLRKL